MARKPPSLDPPRRKRALSDEERTLWDSVAKQFKPLRKRPPRDKVEVVIATPDIVSEADLKPPKMMSAPIALPPKPITPPPLAPIGRRERAQISRGRKEIEARIDLHGMTQARAHRALLSFLSRSSDDGLTLVLVITGKGRSGADGERGVLRRQVPEWLSLPEFRRFVVGFEEAHIGHGGAGALYVRVRRPR